MVVAKGTHHRESTATVQSRPSRACMKVNKHGQRTLSEPWAATIYTRVSSLKLLLTEIEYAVAECIREMYFAIHKTDFRVLLGSHHLDLDLPNL